MNIPNLQRIVDSRAWYLEEIPDGWRELAIAGQTQSYYQHKSGIVVVASIDRMDDGEIWRHISASKKGKNPNWNEMYGVKRVFFGDDTEAIQVLPKIKDIVDITDCLHIWMKG